MEKNREVVQEITQRYGMLTPQGEELLAGILIPLKYRRGKEVILPQGEVCKHLYYVKKGLVRQYYYKKDRSVTERFCQEGEMVFCVESLLKQEPTRVIVETLEETEIYAIPHEELNQLMQEHMDIATLYRKVLEQAAISAQQRVDSLCLETSNERYERLLSEQPKLVLRAPMVHIASYLQMAAETLSRVRNGQYAPAKKKV